MRKELRLPKILKLQQFLQRLRRLVPLRKLQQLETFLKLSNFKDLFLKKIRMKRGWMEIKQSLASNRDGDFPTLGRGG